MAIIIVTFGIMTAGQVPTDDPVLKACEQTADALKLEKAKNAGLETENKLLKEMLSLKDEKIVLIKEQSDFWKKSFDDSNKINTNTGMMLENLRIQVAEYKQENSTLRNENNNLRSSRTLRTAIGFGAGVATGYLITK